MKRLIRFFSLPLLVIISGAVLAEETKPVDIIGITTVDAALNDSVSAQPSPEKHKKHPKAIPLNHIDEVDEVDDGPPVKDTDYTIRAGDVLQITVWKEDNLDREVLVLPDGTIDFPLIGAFKAQGLTPAQLRATIKAKLQPLIRSASVAVLVKATLGHTVSIIGQVNKPGEIIMAHNLTVMQALSQAGGLTPYASEGRIKILRMVNGKETAIEFPYDDVESGDNLDKDIALRSGDVVVVPTATLF